MQADNNYCHFDALECMGVLSARMDAVMPRILIVDDDKGLVRLIGEYLSVCGFEPELAGSAVEARNCLMRSKYDAVLSDFQMPGESGFDLLGQVKSLYPELPFILMTGSNSSRLKHEAMEMGSRYIEKPFQLEDLVETITAVLAPADRETNKPAS
jgi:DNA-binding NtrC family response regulator